MKVLRRVTVLVLLAAAAAVSCHRDESATTHTTSATAPGRGATGDAGRRALPDADIVPAVGRVLREDRVLRSVPIHVAVTDGVATLSGSVPTLLAKDRAVAVAGTIKGVRSVVDDLTVSPIARSDAQIRADLVAELQRDPAERAHPVEVAVKDGVVMLSGTTDSAQARKMIEDTAKAVPGVKRVDDGIAVHYAMIRPQNEIAADVRTRIGNDVWLDGQSISAEVHDGMVRLRGTVASVAQRDRAALDAWVAGVNSVDISNLVVDWWASNDQRHVIDYPVRSDADIAAAVRDAFRYDPRLRELQPAVSVNLGTVVLTGHVDSAKARAAAEEDAKNTVGVWQVHDETTVVPPGKPSDARVEPPARHSAADDGAGRPPGKYAPEDIRASIEDHLFWDPMVDRERIDVAVGPDGVATLTGTVDAWSEIRAATNDARAAGATRVVNLLKLRNHPEVASPNR